MVPGGGGGERGEGRVLGLGSGRSPSWYWDPLWERDWANAGTALTLLPRLFQVLLHVLFEHAVGYALLALKEVEEISLLLPQVSESGGLAGGMGPSMHRALTRGRLSELGVRWARKL